MGAASRCAVRTSGRDSFIQLFIQDTSKNPHFLSFLGSLHGIRKFLAGQQMPKVGWRSFFSHLEDLVRSGSDRLPTRGKNCPPPLRARKTSMSAGKASSTYPKNTYSSMEDRWAYHLFLGGKCPACHKTPSEMTGVPPTKTPQLATLGSKGFCVRWSNQVV